MELVGQASLQAFCSGAVSAPPSVVDRHSAGSAAASPHPTENSFVVLVCSCDTAFDCVAQGATNS